MEDNDVEHESNIAPTPPSVMEDNDAEHESNIASPPPSVNPFQARGNSGNTLRRYVNNCLNMERVSVIIQSKVDEYISELEELHNHDNINPKIRQYLAGKNFTRDDYKRYLQEKAYKIIQQTPNSSTAKLKLAKDLGIGNDPSLDAIFSINKIKKQISETEQKIYQLNKKLYETSQTSDKLNDLLGRAQSVKNVSELADEKLKAVLNEMNNEEMSKTINKPPIAYLKRVA